MPQGVDKEKNDYICSGTISKNKCHQDYYLCGKFLDCTTKWPIFVLYTALLIRFKYLVRPHNQLLWNVWTYDRLGVTCVARAIAT